MFTTTINLRELRQKQGWTQERAAKELGFARSYIAEIETGARGISKGMMQAIVRVFDVPYADFFNAPEERIPALSAAAAPAEEPISSPVFKTILIIFKSLPHDAYSCALGYLDALYREELYESVGW